MSAIDVNGPALDPNDVAFFELVHALLEAEQSEQDQERRSGSRRPYRCVQLVAPYDGQTLPTQAQFRHVNCCDISSHGFSFCTAERPSYDYLVVALGTVPFTVLSAQVMNVCEYDRDGVEYRVGCRFLERIAE